jgi:hypothetical protein
MEVKKDGSPIGILTPEKRFYKASRQGTHEVGVRHRLNEDLYLNFAGMSDDNQRAVIQAYVFPLVSWIWVGGIVLIGGTLICLIPSKVKLQYARTEVVGSRGSMCRLRSSLLAARWRWPRWRRPLPRSPADVRGLRWRASAGARTRWRPSMLECHFSKPPRSALPRYGRRRDRPGHSRRLREGLRQGCC